MRDAGDIARRLALSAPALCGELLPRGRREGSDWRVGSLDGEKGSRVAVRLHGDRAGLWTDHGSGEGGDALSLVASVRFHGDIGEALRWARAWLGLAPGNVAAAAEARPPVAGLPSESAADAADDPGAAERSRKALGMFLSAQIPLRDTPVDHYLRARGICLEELGPQPRSLRYKPTLWNRESGSGWPAMVAAVVNEFGEHVATHRTWLALRDGRWQKAPLGAPKMSFGPVSGGTVRLARGASGKPLHAAPDGEEVVIAEGIETALSVVMACPDRRVLASVSLANMARVMLPPQIRAVIIAADNDPADNVATTRGLRRAVDHFAGQGRIVRIARSAVGKDFNDALVAGQ